MVAEPSVLNVYHYGFNLLVTTGGTSGATEPPGRRRWD